MGHGAAAAAAAAAAANLLLSAANALQAHGLPAPSCRAAKSKDFLLLPVPPIELLSARTLVECLWCFAFICAAVAEKR